MAKKPTKPQRKKQPETGLIKPVIKIPPPREPDEPQAEPGMAFGAIRDRIREFKRVRAGDLIADVRNWRKHPDNQRAAMKGILAEIGYADALLARENDEGKLVLVDGHLRAETTPDQIVPVLVLDLSEEEAAKMLLVFDPISAMAQADDAKLADLIKSVTTSDDALKSMLDGLMGEKGSGGGGVAETATPEPPATPVTRRGDVWIMGNHRLIAGDATDPATIAKLMNGQTADLVITDPPYGVSYVGKTADALVIENYKARDDALVAMLDAAFKNLVKHSKPTAAFYVWHASSTRRDFEWALESAGIAEKQYLTWVKNCFVLGHSDYHYQTEPCFYGVRRGNNPEFYGGRAQSSVWRVASQASTGERVVSLMNGVRLSNGTAAEVFVTPTAPKAAKAPLIRLKDDEAIFLAEQSDGTDAWCIKRHSASPDHPTTKPTALAAIAIHNSSLPGEIVLDLFAGAGFVLLAAHQLARRAYLCELSEAYCDVITRRYRDLCGIPAILESTRQTFDQVAVERLGAVPAPKQPKPKCKKLRSA